MKKILFTIFLLLIALPVNAKMLWEYGSFEERADIAVNNGIVANVSEYKGTYEQNISLLNVLESHYNLENSYNLGASTQPAALSTYNLAGSGVNSSAASLTLQSLTIPQNDHEIQDSDLSDIFYITLEPGSKTRQEIVSCTTVTQNSGGTATLSGCTRGLSPITPYTASTTLRFSHAGGSQVIFSDPPQLFNLYPAKANGEAITGLWTYNTVLPTSTITATSTYQFTNKKYVDNVVNQGAATSSDTVAGISERATRAEISAGTQFNASNPHYISSEHATSTGDVATTSVVITESNGNLNQQFLDLTEDFAFTGDLSNTGSTTITDVDITEADITTASSTTQYIDNVNINTEFLGSASTTYHYHPFDTGVDASSTAFGIGTWTINHDLGVVPKYIQIQTYSDGASLPLGSFGTATNISNEGSTFFGEAAADNPTAGYDTANIIRIDSNDANHDVSATLSALTSTNFTLNFTAVGSSGDVAITWTVKY